MNYLYKGKNVIKSLIFIIGSFLIIGTVFVSCDVNQTEDEAKLMNIQKQKAELQGKFDNLEKALRSMDQEEVTPKMFKKAALKHFVGIDGSDTNFSEVSANYDANYEKAKSVSSGKKLKGKSSNNLSDNGALAELTSKIENLTSYEKADQIFNEFYSQIKNDDTYSIKEKNNLLYKAVYYQAALEFMSSNHDLLRFTGDSKNKVSSLQSCGWWQSWGKCAAGTVGGAITGGLAGCGVSAVPTAGFGCPAGAAAGAIGGGLTGAATSCDGCS